MRRQAIVLAVVALVGLAALVGIAAIIDRDQAFSLGVLPQAVVVELRPGQKVCQGPIDVSEDFERIVLRFTTFAQRGPSLALDVRDVDRNVVVARGRIRAGYLDNTESQVRTGRMRSGSRITVCVTNRGIRRVGVYGSGDPAHAASTAKLDGRATLTDVTMRFLYDRPRSLLRLAPQMIERATLFAPTWSHWLLWTLFGLVALGVPALLTYALARAADEPPPEPPEV